MTRYVLTLLMMAVSVTTIADSPESESINPKDMALPKDEDFRRLDRLTEYEKKLGELLQVRRQNKSINGNEDSEGDANAKSKSSTSATNVSVQQRRVPRALRGKDIQGTEYDIYGNPVNKEKPKTSAYVALVSGMNGDYRAELHWGDQARTVMVGDSPFGGTWKIVAVNMDDIVISNGQGRRIKIGSYPVDVTTLFDE